MDAGNMLKPISRAANSQVGATTIDEYREHIEKDAALERRFQPVIVVEPAVDDTIGILRGLTEDYEEHHGVHNTDAALVAAAKMSDRYIADRFMPDKAIDLVDQAASRLRMEIDSPAGGGGRGRAGGATPGDAGDGAGQGARSSLPAARLDALRKELADRREQLASLGEPLAQREGPHRPGSPRVKEQLETLRREADRAERDLELTSAPPSCATAGSPSWSGN